MGKGKEKLDGPKPFSGDLFSELPDTILHQILSLVPTIHAIRMSLVSKRWRQMCQTIPALSFSYSDFDRNISPESQHAIVSNYLRLREADIVASGNAPVTKFKLYSQSRDYSSAYDWLSLIAKSKVKELDLGVSWVDGLYIILADILCMRSLTHLKLCWVEFDFANDLPLISLPNVVSLVLDNISMTDETLDKLLLGCPSLEKLLLSAYRGLIYPKILSPSLKSLYFRGEVEDAVVLQIDAINLESIVFHGSEIRFKSNLPFCRSLTLSSRFYTGERGDRSQWLEDVISRLPFLESLVLHVHDLRYAKICSQNLRRLTLCMSRDDENEVIIDAPKLIYFSFCGIPPVDVSMNAPNLFESNFEFNYSEKYKFSCHTNLIYFLSKLDSCSKSLVFHVNSEEVLIIPNKLREICKPPLPSVKHMMLRTRDPLLRSRELKESLLWMVPSQETLIIDQGKGMNSQDSLLYWYSSVEEMLRG